jgi:hypothetical protein
MRHPSNRLFEGETVSLRFRELVEVRCCMKVYENVS